jgi:hypothetical protein
MTKVNVPKALQVVAAVLIAGGLLYKLTTTSTEVTIKEEEEDMRQKEEEISNKKVDERGEEKQREECTRSSAIETPTTTLPSTANATTQTNPSLPLSLADWSELDIFWECVSPPILSSMFRPNSPILPSISLSCISLPPITMPPIILLPVSLPALEISSTDHHSANATDTATNVPNNAQVPSATITTAISAESAW